MYFAKKFVIISVIQVRTAIFSHQNFSTITKLQRRRRPASKQNKFLSRVKTEQILQFTRHDLEKKKAFQCAYDNKIENLAEAIFVEIFG